MGRLSELYPERNAEIVRRSLAGQSRAQIATALKVHEHIVAAVVHRARAKGLMPPAKRGHPQRPTRPRHEPMTEADPEKAREDSAEYGRQLAELVLRKLPLTHIATRLRKPYRQIIADMERLGISNVRVR